LLLAEPLENPIQFLPDSRIRLVCAEVLEKAEQVNLFKILKLKAESIALDIKRIQENKNLTFLQTMMFDNLICEYKNFISLLEGLERASKG